MRKKTESGLPRWVLRNAEEDLLAWVQDVQLELAGTRMRWIDP